MAKNKSRNKTDAKRSSDDSDESFRLRPRKPRTGSQSESTAWSIALKTVFRYARSSSRGNGKGRGAKAVGRRTFSQRCAVRIVYSPNRTAGQWRAHGTYIIRENAAREPSAAIFSSEIEERDVASTVGQWQLAGDERMWKIIISPEFGDRVDLGQLTRDVMEQMERDLKTRLEWVAVSHFNTEHPHVHIALRGIREDGSALTIDRVYIRSGIRHRAEDLCTKQLGYRTELDAIAAEEREVSQHRFTSLDKAIAARGQSVSTGVAENATHFVFAAAPQPTRPFLQARQHHLNARLLSLSRMGLAEPIGPDTWRVRRDFDVVLKAMQRASDHQRMLAANGALLSDDRLPLVVVDRRKMDTLVGRVLMHGEDERGGNAGKHYLMLEGTDEKVHLMYYTPEMEEARSRGGLCTNSFIRLRKLFVNGQPLIQIEDLGDSEALLRNRQYMSSAARNLIKRGIVPTENGWGGWLGRYQSALSRAALQRDDRYLPRGNARER
jgi:type IV secretory pathway VirD2 relaxase